MRSVRSSVAIGTVFVLVLAISSGTAGAEAPHSAVGSAVGYTLDEAPDVGGPPFPIGTTLPLALSFSAVEQPDGRATGRGVAHPAGLGGQPTAFHFTVECVSFDGNEAWFGVRITKAAFPFPETFGFWVEDNGEGVGADPDRLSSASFTQGLPGGQAWCDEQPDHPEKWTIEHGNIQVRS